MRRGATPVRRATSPIFISPPAGESTNNIDIDINVKVYRRGMRTAHQRFSPCGPGTEERLPWPALLVLGSATLVMVPGEMLPTAVLGAMSAGLGVTEASTGMLVSLWAL